MIASETVPPPEVHPNDRAIMAAIQAEVQARADAAQQAALARACAKTIARFTSARACVLSKTDAIAAICISELLTESRKITLVRLSGRTRK